MPLTLWMQQHRRQLLIGVPSGFLLVGLLFYLFSGQYVSTDNAYMQAAKATISANISGQVIKIYVHDNQMVEKNKPLFKIDDRVYRIAVKEAQAQLSNARLQIQALKATYKQRLADVQAAEHTFTYQQEEFNRQKKLAAAGISSQMQLNKATNDLHNATQQLAAIQQQLAQVRANLGNNADIAIDEHPIVQQAQAQLDLAQLNLAYTTVIAPMAGIVTKVEQLQPGDYIKAGMPVFALISHKDIWVEANFRETDITHMHPGQRATIQLDTYPDKKFKGKVISLSPGTGAAFSLLPPENATGNWVKIVQRIPVRISIDSPEPSFTLISGLSATVTVDTLHHRIFYIDQ